MDHFTLVFDIGKTNKKCLLFDADFTVKDKVEKSLPETVDDENFPCEDIHLLSKWILDTFKHFYQKYGVKIRFLNFSTYGASFVHFDEDKEIILPLYNYLKPLKEGCFDDFYAKYGGKENFSKVTASPALNMLNSGLQLLWIKQEKPDQFQRIKYSLHFPNYCSYLFHGKLYSEYTSIGCHTALWDFEKMSYHPWVQKEGIATLFPEIIKGTCILDGMVSVSDNLKVGVGLHDSSAALVPYLFGVREKFILISTGTWSITLNPFSTVSLTIEELEQDTLQFLRVNGQQVKAARLFLGNEFNVQIKALNKHYGQPADLFKSILFSEKLFDEYVQPNDRFFTFHSLNEEDVVTQPIQYYHPFEKLYYQLNYELVQKQLAAYHLAKANTKDIKTVFIDGGFSNNEVFCKMLARQLTGVSLKKTKLAAGSSLGAAVVMRPELFTPAYFEEILGVEEV